MVSGSLFLFTCWSYFGILFILAGAVCKLNSVKHSLRTSAMKKTDRDGPLAQNAKVVEGCLAHCLHMTNTGAVVCYAERRIVHCRMRTDSMLRLHRAAQRPNMSTAALERRPAKPHARWRTLKAYFAYFADHACNSYATISKRAYPPVGPF